jgi:hypothetical protein
MNTATGVYLQSDVPVNDSNRWLLTTELFNDFYHASSNISDFCNVDNSNTEFYDKMRISPTSKSTIKNGSGKPYEEPEGELIKHGSDAISYLYKHTQRVSIEVSSKFVIDKPDLYPDTVNINNNYVNNIEIDSVYVSKLGNIQNPSADPGVAEGQPKKYNTVFRSLLTTTEGPRLTTSGTNNP